MKFEIGGLKVVTKTIKDNINPLWNQRVKLPMHMPTSQQYLIIRLVDFDSGVDDEISGTVKIKIDDIIKGLTQEAFWVNYYGCPNGVDKDIRNQLCSSPESGIFFSGKLIFLS